MSTDESKETDEPRHPYETEESFHPMGKEWEDDMRDKLEETDYDADLGMQMARDAQRLVAGEISEEEFYAEYHEDVEEEFETDARPIFDDLDGVDLDEVGDDRSMLESLKDVDLEADDVSRRSMMKKRGAAGLFLGYSAYASYDNGQDDQVPQEVSGVRPADEDEREHRWGMVIDLERCDGCLSCVAGCINENGTSTGANWMYVFTYEDEQSGQDNFLVRPCQHCSNAPCAKVCPVRARHTRQKDGIVLTNYETCIGCRYCQVACPYGVNYFQWGDPDVEMGRLEFLDATPDQVQSMDAGDGPEYRAGTYAEEGSERHEALSGANDHVYDARGWWVDSRPPTGVMGKCTFCPSRQDDHTGNPKGTVACMNACDETGMSAIHFGDLDAEIGDDYDRAVRYLERRKEIEPSPEQKNSADPRPEEEGGDGYGWANDDQATPQDRDDIYVQEDWENPPAPHEESQLSTFKLLENLGTEPNITYIGNEPGPDAEQKEEGPVRYEDLQADIEWPVEVKDERKEHLDYGAGGPPEEGEGEA